MYYCTADPRMDRHRKRNSCNYIWFTSTRTEPLASRFEVIARQLVGPCAEEKFANPEGALAPSQTRCLSTARTLKEAKTFLAH